MPPTVPIRLIMALALLLRGLGVISGMRATAGERNTDIKSRTKPVIIKKNTRFRELSAMGIKKRAMLAATVPMIINGIRFPRGVCILSDKDPNIGKRKSARTLSTAMIAPIMTSFSENVFLRIRGMILSYICQKAIMDIKANPTITVLYL